MIRFKTFRLKDLILVAVVIILLILLIVFVVRCASSDREPDRTVISLPQAMEIELLGAQAGTPETASETQVRDPGAQEAPGSVSLADIPEAAAQHGTTWWDRLLSFLFGLDFNQPYKMLSGQAPMFAGVDWDMLAEAANAAVAAQSQLAAVTADMEEEDELYVAEEIPEKVRIEIASLGADDMAPIVMAPGAEPQILIYHTHTHEAYQQVPEHPYIETGDWRTADTTQSVVEIGNLLAKELRSKYGFSVIHDTTNHEPPKLSSSYNRSLETMEKYKAQYPSIQVFIDVHRDAYTAKDGRRDIIKLDGKELARMMCVVGTGDGKTGTGLGQKPDYKSNYALAAAVTDTLNSYADNLARPVRVKSGRYNQHMSSHCLLMEVGHNENSLQEAKNSVPYLAKAIAEALR